MPHTEMTVRNGTPSAERRGEKRFALARPGKVFRRTTRRYAPAATINLSVGGALLDIETDRSIATGELIDLAVAFGDQALVRGASLVRGLVLRADPPRGRRQRIAVRYVPAGSGQRTPG